MWQYDSLFGFRLYFWHWKPNCIFQLTCFLFFYSPFPGMLSQFPPPTVRLKLPFSIKPWTGSEDNVGKLLMVMLYSSYILALFFLLFGHFLRDVEILNISWLVLLAKILRLPWFINGHTIFMGTSFLRNINCEGRCHLPCWKTSKTGCVLGFCRGRPLDASPVFLYILYGPFLILNEMAHSSPASFENKEVPKKH